MMLAEFLPFQYLVPLLFLVLWVLNQILARASEPPKAEAANRPRDPNAGPRPAPPRRPAGAPGASRGGAGGAAAPGRSAAAGRAPSGNGPQSSPRVPRRFAEGRGNTSAPARTGASSEDYAHTHLATLAGLRGASSELGAGAGNLGSDAPPPEIGAMPNILDPFAAEMFDPMADDAYTERPSSAAERSPADRLRERLSSGQTETLRDAMMISMLFTPPIARRGRPRPRRSQP